MSHAESPPRFETPPRQVIPIELQLIRRLPGPLVLRALLVALALVGSYLLVRWSLGIPGWESNAEFGYALTGSARISVVLALLVGYTLAVGRYMASAFHQDFAALGIDTGLTGADLDVDDPELFRVSHEHLRRTRWSGAAGLAIGVLAIVATLRLLGSPIGEAVTDISDAGLIALALLFFWLLGRAAYSTIGADVNGPNFIEQGIQVDLMDLAQLRPVGRMALRGSLVWIVGASIASLLFLTPEFSSRVLWAFAPIFLVILAIAAMALLMPVRGVQRRIRSAKEDEITRVDAELSRVRGLALSGEAASQERLAGLLAYRRHVDELPEWPFDARMRTRFIFYLLIPLGSWLGGAFVERGVSALVD